MKVTKTDVLPTVGTFPCLKIEGCRIRHPDVPQTDEIGAHEGTEWFLKVTGEPDYGEFSAYAWVWLRQADGDFGLREFVLSEDSGLDPDSPIFKRTETPWGLAGWARRAIEERLADEGEQPEAA